MDLALMLITKQQPVASDLRRIFIFQLKQREYQKCIADHAVNIAKSTIRLGEKEVVVSLRNLEEMFEIAHKMLNLALEAYEQENLTFAKQIAENG